MARFLIGIVAFIIGSYISFHVIIFILISGTLGSDAKELGWSWILLLPGTPIGGFVFSFLVGQTIDRWKN